MSTFSDGVAIFSYMTKVKCELFIFSGKHCVKARQLRGESHQSISSLIVYIKRTKKVRNSILHKEKEGCLGLNVIFVMHFVP